MPPFVVEKAELQVPPINREQPATVVYVFLDLGDGGAQRVALTWWRLLDRSRIRPVALCLRGGGGLVADAVATGVPVIELRRMRHSWDVEAAARLARVLRRLRADVVHVASYSRAAPYAVAAARLAGVPVTVVHEHWRIRAATPARRLADRALRDGPWYIAVSHVERDRLLAEGVAAANIELLPNGVEDRYLAGFPRDAARAALGVPEDRPMALAHARLVPRKGHVDLLAAWGTTLARVPGALLLIAGDGPLRRVLAGLVASAGLDPSVQLLGHREDVVELVAASDAVVLPSTAEGQPLSLLEAMAGGRPVVATAVGGVPDVVDDGRTGYLVPPRRPAVLSDALARLLEDPDRAQAMGRAAQEAVRRHFRAEPIVRRLEALYATWLEVARHSTRAAKAEVA